MNTAKVIVILQLIAACLAFLLGLIIPNPMALAVASIALGFCAYIWRNYVNFP